MEYGRSSWWCSTLSGDTLISTRTFICWSPTGGLSEAESRWIEGLTLNPVGFMKLWRHGIVTYLRLALAAGILKSDLKSWELRELLADKYEVGWHVDMQERISKRHFLGYAARYIRRPPIAQHRFQETDGPKVKFLTEDT